ncbi:hypothetical protein BCR35DRAFT_304659 [Leucosporidium creatinivorum]|uniref:Uncharacterized protein n=1 Tax=Leucosporidium creatinivorum TaxID=106004 RepID=A0A1Y2F5Z2_9BASI|nr:hypothetical protein BCR35DRAFT_304659 [Leucosporidium creatinivorum]
MSEHSSSSSNAAGSTATPPSDISPAPTAPTPLVVPPHRDVYIAEDGVRCIGKPIKKQRAPAPLVLYLEKVDLGGGKTLEGSKDEGKRVLRFEVMVESRSLKVGYVEVACKGEVKRSKEMEVALKLACHDLRSAKVHIQRLNERGGSSVEITLEAVEKGADTPTLIFTVDTRESSSFDSYALERVKSTFKEWARRERFPTTIDLTRALPVPAADSALVHLPPPASFDPNEPTTWFPPFVPRKEKEKKKKRERQLESEPEPEPEFEQEEDDDDSDWVEDSKAGASKKKAPAVLNSPSDLEDGGPTSSRRTKRKSIPSRSLRELSIEEQEEEEVARLLGPAGGAIIAKGDADDVHEPSPKKPKKQASATANGKEKEGAPAPRKGYKADLMNQTAALSKRLHESEQKVAQLEETAARVPALEEAVAMLPALVARLGQVEAELARLRPERGESVAMEDA